MRERRSGTPASEIARRTLIATLVVLAVAVLAVALWKIRIVVGLLFFAIVIASAMRPGVESLHRRGIPRGLGVAVHYLVLAGVLAVLVWVAVPRALTQVEHAIATLPQTRTELRQKSKTEHGIKHDLLVGIERRLRDVPTASDLFSPAVEITKKVIEVVVGLFFLFASAAYWIFERDRAERVVLSLVPRRKRDTVRETWNLIDLKLGAFIRGQLLLILLVGTVLSLVFWAIGEPYWLLIGPFAGIVEIVPVIGPLAAGVIAVGIGFTASWQVALYAGIAVLGVRLIEDYLVVPRVLGDAVGLSPLIVLVAISASGILLGGLAVLFAVPLAAVVATVIDVVVLKKDPAQEEVPTVLFPARDAEG